jgi:predicted RNase H-like HicB family nuclease
MTLKSICSGGSKYWSRGKKMREGAMATERVTATELLRKPYARVLIPSEDGGFTAEILEFPGCRSYGSTPDEAYQGLERAAESWIEASLDQGQEIPEPFGSVGFSGKFALRMPRSLHRRAASLAERDRVSLNQFCVTAIAERVGADNLFSRLEQKLTTNMTMTINVGTVSMNTTNAGVFVFRNEISSTGGIPLANSGAAFGTGMPQTQWYSSGGGLTISHGLGVGTTGTLTSTALAGPLGTGTELR